MEPHIREDELALVRKQNDVESGELAVVVINDDEGTIKKVIKCDNYIILQPFNPDYETVVISRKELKEVSIVGKVTATIRKWQ